MAFLVSSVVSAETCDAVLSNLTYSVLICVSRCERHASLVLTPTARRSMFQSVAVATWQLQLAHPRPALAAARPKGFAKNRKELDGAKVANR